MNQQSLIRRARRFAVDALSKNAINRLPNCYIRPTAKLYGRPIVTAIPGSSIRIGEYAKLISDPCMTDLAVNHAVTLRTLSKESLIVIGNDVGISGGTICAVRKVLIGDGTMLGANVIITDTDFHPADSADRRYKPIPKSKDGDEVIIGTNVFVGTGAIILKGTTIGNNSVIGAGSVVKGEVPPNSIFAGNPARHIRPIADSNKQCN